MSRLLTFLFLVLVAGASRVYARSLELDGNATGDSGPGLPDDWEDLVLGTGGTSNFQFQSEILGKTVFSTTTSDRNDQFLADWDWIDDPAAVLAPADILDGFCARYGNEFYFGLDRKSNAADLHVSLWLLQDVVKADAGGSFLGSHRVGDVLLDVFYDRVNASLSVTAYRWVGTGGSVAGTLDPVSLTPSEYAVLTNSGSDCAPWPYVPDDPVACGCGACFPPGSFFEGFLDLDVVGLGCFRTVIMASHYGADVLDELRDFIVLEFPTQLDLGSVCPGATLCAPLYGTYIYSWSNGATTPCLVDPAPADYTVTMTDQLTGCVILGAGTVLSPPIVTLSSVCEGNPLCATATGGMLPFNFLWSTGSTASCASAVGPGLYWVTVTDGLGCSTTASASIVSASICPQVCVALTAVVTGIEDYDGLLGGSIVPGTELTGQYVYDPRLPDTNPRSWVGDYENTVSGYGISLSGGGYTFKTDPAAVDFVLEVVNDHGVIPTDDYFLISYNNAPLTGGIPMEFISWQLTDATATVFSSTDLPLAPPNLADWSSPGIRVVGGDMAPSYFLFYAQVTDARYCEGTLDAGPGPESRPVALSAYPNPFTASTRVTFDVKREGEASLRVFGIDGRLRRTVYQGTLSTGFRTLDWDGRDDQGRPVAAGLYVLQLKTPENTVSRRVMRLR